MRIIVDRKDEALLECQQTYRLADQITLRHDQKRLDKSADLFAAS
jgi:hypothetical protein